MSEGKIGRISFAVEIDGKPYFVALPQERLRVLVTLAGSLSDSGKLPVLDMPEGFKFTELETNKGEA
jgi:hypothetical protein